MKPTSLLKIASLTFVILASLHVKTSAAPATLLFEDDFNRGIPGWTAVQPPGTYIEGPMRWQYDIVSGSFVEQSNIYTDNAAASPSATAVMLINDTVAGANFTYKARLVAGDNDSFGLIFGYQNPTNFYRVNFPRETRGTPGFPWNEWSVDRKVNNVATNLFGFPVEGHQFSFINTQYQPFDVTIGVTNGNFSLTVVDDPEGFATEYKLVESQPLPGPANGKVGLYTWGMSGTALRGFRIINPTLEPTALAGNPNALTNWTPVVTPGHDGLGLDPASGHGGNAIWSLALGQNGMFGTLHENSDSFGHNVGDDLSRIGFASGSLVAGDDSWSNYVVKARILPGDDDGHGLLLRYKDEHNFYRIAMRAQANTTAGVKTGLSIQKVVNGIWEEIYSEADPVQFRPPNNVPYDISAQVDGNRIQILIVADPLGTPTVFSYGPFELTGESVPAGKVGFFSWGMSRLEVDFVRVYAVEGTPLEVASQFGNPSPARGLHGFPPASSVTASVESLIEDAPGIRKVLQGYIGTGSVPASGTENSVTFNLNQISSITWLWSSEIRVNVTATAGGQVNAPTSEWLPEGSQLSVTATANPGFMFTGWRGGAAGHNPQLNVTLNRPFTAQAHFAADSDSDLLPDEWEQSFFGNLNATAAGDADNDGISNAEEYARGSNPAFAEVLISDDGLDSRWMNVQRDPALPGVLIVRDFGNGFRGVWENSNDFREADTNPFIPAELRLPNISFEGPRIIIRPEVWQSFWNDNTASAIFSVGDNDGSCVYFRYKDENNWYRVTISAEANNASWRAMYGISIQKRFNGVFSEILSDPTFATDPLDGGPSFRAYKRVLVSVESEGANFEVRVIGWDTTVEPARWDTAQEAVLTFTDADIPEGRFGVGSWGQSGGNTATPSNPVNAGLLIEDVHIAVDDQIVFTEDWSGVPLAAELPQGWTNPQTGQPAGTWQVTAHGTLLQTSNYSTPATGTLLEPKGDGEGTILLAPAQNQSNYLLQLGFHPFDDDGIGFVYDFTDINNYSRVIFVAEATAAARIPQGVTVGRKSNGVWTDIIIGDQSFVYVNGSPFAVEFSAQGGEFRLRAWQLDDPSQSQTWTWSAPAVAENSRFGFTTWGETDAHFLYSRAYSLSGGPVGGDVEITSISVEGGNLVLTISKPDSAAYIVERSTSLLPDSWTTVAENQTGASWSTALPAGAGHAFWRIRLAP